jgi:hypothetical protein
MDVRWGGGEINRIRALAQELVGLQSDIILTSGTVATAAVQRETRTIPIVFVVNADPIATGIVVRLDRPRAGAQVARISPKIHRERDQEMGRCDQGGKYQGGVTRRPLWVKLRPATMSAVAAAFLETGKNGYVFRAGR